MFIEVLSMLTAKEIITDKDIRIKEKSQEVELPLNQVDQELAQSLLDYVVNSTDEKLQEENDLKPAVGISAIQVGLPKRILAIAYTEEVEEGPDTEVRYLLANAKIIRHSLRTVYLGSGEGCLSVEEEHEGYVQRAYKITVRAYDILAKTEVLIEANEYLAVVLQHEIDHFNGILYYERINKTDPYHIPDNSVEI